MSADELGGFEAGYRLDRLREVREDAVGRLLDQEPIALLGLAQLPLEAVPLAHVAHAAVRPGEPAAIVPRAEGDELGRHWVAVAVEQVDPAAELAVLAHPGGPVDL